MAKKKPKQPEKWREIWCERIVSRDDTASIAEAEAAFAESEKPFRLKLAKLQERLAREIVPLMTDEDQATDDDAEHAGHIETEAWHPVLADMWSTLRHLERAIDSGDTNTALHLAFELGREQQEMEYRKRTVDVLVAQKVQMEMLATTSQANRESKDRKRQDAVAQLHAINARAPHLSRDAIAQQMAAESKWGSLATLRRYFKGVTLNTSRRDLAQNQ